MAEAFTLWNWTRFLKQNSHNDLIELGLLEQNAFLLHISFSLTHLNNFADSEKDFNTETINSLSDGVEAKINI